MNTDLAERARRIRRVFCATRGDQLRRHAQHQPDRPIVIEYDGNGRRREITYSQFDAQVNELAAGLAGLGVAKGDVIAALGRITEGERAINSTQAGSARRLRRPTPVTSSMTSRNRGVAPLLPDVIRPFPVLWRRCPTSLAGVSTVECLVSATIPLR